jgi:hypothetical protein
MVAVVQNRRMLGAGFLLSTSDLGHGFRVIAENLEQKSRMKETKVSETSQDFG